MGNPEIDRIRNDMARCKQRIAEMHQGSRGVRSGEWSTTKLGDSGAGLAFGNQLLAQETVLAKLESEYLYAMIPVWGVSRIIERMETPTPLVSHG